MTQPRGAVAFRNVRKSFGEFTAIHDLSLDIAPGQLVTLLGPSGCGKTTTLRMLAGLESPSDGRILIGGDDVTRLPADRRDVSMVFQSYALWPHMSVADNVAYGLEAGGQSKALLGALLSPYVFEFANEPPTRGTSGPRSDCLEPAQPYPPPPYPPLLYCPGSMQSAAWRSAPGWVGNWGAGARVGDPPGYRSGD